MAVTRGTPSSAGECDHGLVLTHLRGGEDHRPINVRRSQILDNREVFIRCAGWGVYNEVVDISPVYITEELLDHAWKGARLSVCPPSVHISRRIFQSA